MDPIRPIGPATGDQLRVIPVAPARIRERDADERGQGERNRKRGRDRRPNAKASDTPGHVDIQA